MMNQVKSDAAYVEDVLSRARKAAEAIPPLWPLTTSVAVNPFLGQASETLSRAGARLARVAGSPVTMPRRWFAERVASGAIAEQDLVEALANADTALKPTLTALKSALDETESKPTSLPSIADLAASASNVDWPSIVADRMGAWAAGYFDRGQALWAASNSTSPYKAWRSTATHDLTPEILGLHGFGKRVADGPDVAVESIVSSCNTLGLKLEAMETYFHQLLITMGGWAQIARYRLWQAQLGGQDDFAVIDMLAIRLVWETALLDQYETKIKSLWQAVRSEHAQPLVETRSSAINAILQHAYDGSYQRSLADLLTKPQQEICSQPDLQVAFCIDVRSEVFRRMLESLDARIQTIGFAGFFGVGTAHQGFASDVRELRLPVLLSPALSSHVQHADGDADTDHRVKARAKRAWGRFKLAAVSSFAFVEASGPAYAAKLVRDAVGLTGGRSGTEPMPVLDPLPSASEQVSTAETVLRAMSLTRNFAKLVVLCGHGAHTVNNPHASALHCGACGGYAGDVNARLLASLLNDKAVREGLRLVGIDIPTDTLFVAALHDTTTDTVTMFADDFHSPSHQAGIGQAKTWFSAAGALTRDARAARLPHAKTGGGLFRRARDWAEVRPEWGLAGCRAFIAAPRARTAGKDLAGQAFLHDYDWRLDSQFKVLELILTAPVVVASWISLQYYGSTISPQMMGAGNKLLHNVTGGVTVIEGNGGPARAGLPWQSVHDGQHYAHEPLRLSVCIEAPREAISNVLANHGSVRDLFDNSWMHLFAMDDRGRLAWRYGADKGWLSMATVGNELAVA